jgi:hypothetical protein
VPGYASPVGLKRGQVMVLADDLVASSSNLVAGANEPDYHLRNTCIRASSPARGPGTEVGYEPTVSLEDGLRQTLEWARQ